jgi:hypothetical protein
MEQDVCSGRQEGGGDGVWQEGGEDGGRCEDDAVEIKDRRGPDTRLTNLAQATAFCG